MPDKFQYKKALSKKILSLIPFNYYWRLLPYAYLRTRSDISKSKLFETRFSLYEYLFEGKKNNEIILLEFGTFKGESLKKFCELNDNVSSVFYSFDTFVGLPTDWHSTRKGHFDVGGNVPQIEDKRVSYQIGLFRDTFFEFIKNTELNKDNTEIFIHIDSDLFSSVVTVLPCLIGYYKLDNFTLIYDEFTGDEAVMHQFIEQIFMFNLIPFFNLRLIKIFLNFTKIFYPFRVQKWIMF